MTDARALTEVAVGLVFDQGGRVLLGQRPEGKPYAGWWEFPGGKLESGEGVAEALARELHEELGLELRASLPWIVREHSYPHARVRLHFRRVFDWRGVPTSREGQAFAWVRPEAIDRSPLLPATLPILGMLGLPPVCIGVDVRAAARTAAQTLPAGALQVLHGAERLSAAGRRAALERARAAGARVFVDESWSGIAAGCDGLVAAPDALPPRGRFAGMLGVRLERIEALARLGEVDADFAILTVDVSTCLDSLARRLASVPIPVYAICDPQRAATAAAAGLHGRVLGDWPSPA